MATNIGSLFVNFGVNATGFIKGTDKAKKKLTEFQKHALSVQKTLSTFKTAFATIGVGIGVNALVRTFTDVIGKLDELGDTAEKLNIDPTKLGGLRFAAEQTSSSAEAMTQALETIPVKAADAVHGMKKVQKVFQELGVDAKELLKLSPDQMFLKVSEAIKQLPTAGEQMRFAERLFGGDASSLLPMLRQGEAGLKKFTDQYTNAMGDMSSTTMQAADEAQQAINELKLAWEGLKKEIAMTTVRAARGTGQMDSPQEMARWFGEVIRGDWQGKAAARRQIMRDVEVENRLAANMARPTTGRQLRDEEAHRNFARAKAQRLLEESAASRWLWNMPERLLKRRKWVDEKGKTVDTKVFVNPLMETIRSHIESATGLLKAAGPAIEKAEAIGRRWQFWEFFVKPFLPKAKVPKRPNLFTTDAFTAKRMDSPEAIQAENRFKQMAANIQNKQLLEQKTANQHLQRIERNVRQEAQIKVVEVGIVG